MAKVWLIPDKEMNHTIANLDGVKDAVYDQAKEIGRRAESRLAAHNGQPLPGGITDNASSIEVRRNLPSAYGHIDADVSLVDAKNAVAIEFGHYLTVYGRKTKKFVPGLYIVTGAAGVKTKGKYSRRRGRG